jgi:hypothetical protein
VAAALSTSGALEGDLRYEFIGDWSKVRGKFEKRESQNRGNNSNEPKFYIVPTYTKADEEGLGVRAIGRLRGEREDRIVELYLSQCYPRFSTQWANNPEQQIIYAVDRVWARRHKPSVMLGVYTEDELADPGAQSEKFMGEADVVSSTPAAPPPPSRKEAIPRRRVQASDAYVAEGDQQRQDASGNLAAVELRNPEFALSEKQKAVILSLKKLVVENEPTKVDPNAIEARGHRHGQTSTNWRSPATSFAMVQDADARARLQGKYDTRESCNFKERSDANVINFNKAVPNGTRTARPSFNATDAAAVLGLSPHMTRTDLLTAQEDRRCRRGSRPSSQQRRFDEGHEFEARARPLAEKIIGEPLYPKVGVDGEWSAHRSTA